ncbi:MAG: 3-deoxy-D-manno-octulosonic acid transferase [Myxococcota bacterium]
MGPIAHSLAFLLAAGLSPAVALAWLLRPGLRRHFGERLGRLPVELDRALSGGPSPLYVHAASIGEAKAAIRLIEGLEALGHPVVATTSTVGGRDVLRCDRPHGDSHLFPLDHPWATERLLRRARPAISVLIETELWPNWIAGCARHDVPVVVASGRLSDRSFPRYRRVRRLLRPTLSRVEAVGARTELDAERFIELGVPESRVAVTGDLKLDPPPDQPALSIDLIRALADCPVVVGGSTHEGEEGALLEAMEAAEKAGHVFVLVLAPRRVARCSEVVSLAKARRRRVVRRSELEGRHLVPGEVLVLDTIGELPALYATASIAFVGGTLAPIGGHNLVEPVHAGCPVLFGPRVENVRKIVEILELGDAGRKVQNPAGLAAEIVAAFDDLEACRVRGEIGRETLEAHRGSVEATRQLIEEVRARRAGPAD